MEYNKEQLAEIVKGCFKNSNEPAFFGDKNGTFYNTDQKSRLKKAHQDELIEFRNPALETAKKKASPEPDNHDLSKMKVEELKAHAAKFGIALKEEDKTKAQIIAT